MYKKRLSGEELDASQNDCFLPTFERPSPLVTDGRGAYLTAGRLRRITKKPWETVNLMV